LFRAFAALRTPFAVSAALPVSAILTADFFAVFGLAPQFEIDLAALDRAYREVQTRVHPDRFAAGTDVEKRQAVQWATHANEAYKTLKAPVARARYLLTLRGVETREETNTAMPVDFLMQQMEWRETLAGAGDDVSQLSALAEDAAGARQALLTQLAQELQHEQNQAAATSVRKLRFIEKLESEIDDALDRV
jgi:molecular chaperone HscB